LQGLPTHLAEAQLKGAAPFILEFDNSIAQDPVRFGGGGRGLECTPHTLKIVAPLPLPWHPHPNTNSNPLNPTPPQHNQPPANRSTPDPNQPMNP